MSHLSFDDNGFGISKDRTCLQERYGLRPPDLTNQQWYSYADSILKMIRDLPPNLERWPK